MTDLIEQMKASLVGVTDGPWYVGPGLAVQDEHGNTIALVRAKVERAFIAAARTLLPEAIKEIEELRSRAEAAEAKVAKYEQRDGMDGAVVYAIRELLNAQNVPHASFIDDHVANAIRQRNAAEAKANIMVADKINLRSELLLIEAKLAKAVGALERIASGELSGYILTSEPPQDPAVVAAEIALGKIGEKP